MTAFVVDTNVAVVANNQSSQADKQCVLNCTKKLIGLRNAKVCMDSGDEILKEYRDNLLQSGQPGVGDAFMKWIHQNQYNQSVCERVTIIKQDKRGYKEFPDDSTLVHFDSSDRKFVAVALGSQLSPTILNAVDSDWSQHRKALRKHGVVVEELCLNCLKKG